MSAMDTCCTTISEHHSHFTWKIVNFSEFLNFHNNDSAENILKSSIFTTEDRSQWYMKVDITKAEISFYLYLKSSKANTPVSAKYNVYVMGLNQQLFINYKTKIYHYVPQNDGYGFKKYISRNDFAKNPDLLVNGNLEIHCELTVVGTPSRLPKIQVLKSQYSADFAKLHQNPNDTDWSFVVGEILFNVHSAILQSRSPVFAELFATNNAELNKEHLTKITDIRSEVFAKLLEYIYTDNVTNIQDCALDLLVAADKHKLEKLKNLCEKEVFKNINVDNASTILIMADRHNAQQLVVITAQYINANREQVVKTTWFREIEENHSDLLGKLFKLI